MNTKLAKLNQTTLECIDEIDESKVVEKFTNTGIDILSADFGFMFWKLDSHGSYELIYKSPETPYEPKLPRKRGYNYKAFEGKAPNFINNPKRDLLPYMKSLVSIPIFYQDHQYGNMVLCFKNKHVFGPEEQSLSITLSNTMAHVLTIYRTRKKSEKESLKLLKQKDEFFNIASHELRTPVTTIKGFAQILSGKLKNKNGDLDKETNYLLDKVNLHIDKLTKLINDLLDVSRIETGKLKFKKTSFELSQLIERTIEDMKVVIPRYKVDFINSYNVWLRGDKGQIERVLTNLVTNAAKYSPAGSKIKVSLKIEKMCVRVSIEDFGIGISRNDRSKVFNRFFQTRKTAERNHLPGLGLGLYIAKIILKHHEGRLEVKSKRSSKGSVFSFSIPYERYNIITK